MITPEYALLMSRYNRWVNESLFDACAALSEELRKEDRGATYRSIHGTLNHLLLGDRLWMGRFTGVPFPIQALDQELYSNFETLRREREKTDQDIETWMRQLSEEALALPFRFTSVLFSREYAFPLGVAIVQFFNHQTHHRGQLTTLLHQAGADFGHVDLIWMPGAEL
jgi:uncharacterized damage-inducible protein DinB